MRVQRITACLMLFSSGIFAQENQAPLHHDSPVIATESSVKKNMHDFCEHPPKNKDFIKAFFETFIKNTRTKSLAYEILSRNEINSCKIHLEKSVLHKIKLSEKEGEDIPEFFVAIGLFLNMKEMSQALESQVINDHQSHWLDVIEHYDSHLYAKIMDKNLKQTAKNIRKTLGVQNSDTPNYGLPLNHKIAKKFSRYKFVWDPIPIHKYLKTLYAQRKKCSLNDFESFNILMATTEQAYRGIFFDEYAAVIRDNAPVWIESLHKENTWILFRLFPLMAKVGDGPVKRELIWMQKYHQDEKIRALALASLRKLSGN